MFGMWNTEENRVIRFSSNAITRDVKTSVTQDVSTLS